MCYVEGRAVRRTAIYSQKRFRSRRNRFFEFTLYHLIRIAAELKWIPTKEIRLNRRKTTLQELLHAARDTRNLIHSAPWPNEPGPTTTRKPTSAFISELSDQPR